MVNYAILDTYRWIVIDNDVVNVSRRFLYSETKARKETKEEEGKT